MSGREAERSLHRLSLDLDEETWGAVEEAARRRHVSPDELLAAALDAYLLPRTTREAEAEELQPFIARPPLERLAPPLRAGVLAFGEVVRRRWTAGRGGRYRIGPRLLTNGRIRLAGPGRISVGSDVNAWARSGTNRLETFRPEAEIVVGDRVRLNGAGIQAASSVHVGDDAILGSCTILDTDHHAVSPEERRAGGVRTRPITIGRNAWIAGAVVLKGVCVGENSVVGLGSVVTEDVPANVVVAGNPARIVRRLD